MASTGAVGAIRDITAGAADRSATIQIVSRAACGACLRKIIAGSAAGNEGGAVYACISQEVKVNSAVLACEGDIVIGTVGTKRNIFKRTVLTAFALGIVEWIVAVITGIAGCIIGADAAICNIA